MCLNIRLSKNGHSCTLAFHTPLIKIYLLDLGQNIFCNSFLQIGWSRHVSFFANTQHVCTICSDFAILWLLSLYRGMNIFILICNTLDTLLVIYKTFDTRVAFAVISYAFEARLPIVGSSHCICVVASLHYMKCATWRALRIFFWNTLFV